jgi:IS30 family transposase
MTRHAEFSAATGMPVFFCDAYSPWQRGSNENTNGLLREFFAKETNLACTTPEQLVAAVDELNHRPRRALEWRTPH